MTPSELAANDVMRRIRWREMRCARCRHLLQKIEDEALRPGKRLEIKCAHCKVMNYLVGESLRPLMPGSVDLRSRPG